MGDMHAAGFFIGVAVLFGGLWLSERRRKRNPGREPRTDFPPFLLDVATGYTHPCYTAPVRAVTPGGILVRQGKCCVSGHVSPAQAVAHAGKIAARIETRGR